MKKILALALAATMALSMVACSTTTSTTDDTGSNANSSTTDNNTDTDTDTDTEAAFTTVQEGKLIMGTNAAFPPYEYYENNVIVGIDAEIAGAIADKLGLELVIEDMEFGSIITAVTTGKADMGLAGMTVTAERQESVDFTATYATGVQVVIVTEDSEITSVDDLFDVGGYTIGVQMNTTGDLYTTWDLEDYDLATIDRYSRGADAVQALVTGKVDCVVIDNQPALAFVAEYDNLKILDTEYVLEDYAAAMSKDNTALYEAVDAALSELIADGTVQSIIDKYISED